MSASTFWRDERAIEGLPIRLVIALVVGVAALGVMMSIIGGLGSLNTTELDTEPDPDIVPADQETTVNVTVVDPDGNEIEGATVLARGDTASLAQLHRNETGADGVATIDIEPTLGPNQDEGRVELDIRPPHGDYVDERDNTDILVID